MVKDFDVLLNRDEMTAVISALSIFSPMILLEEGDTAEYHVVKKLIEKMMKIEDQYGN